MTAPKSEASPEEMAREIVVHHEKEWSYVNKGQHLRAAIAQALREAYQRGAEEEREACAALCERNANALRDIDTMAARDMVYAHESCASWIRARGGGEGTQPESVLTQSEKEGACPNVK